MFIDFQTADRDSAPSTDSCPSPIDARCWLTSEITCDAKLALFVPHDASGVQTLSARALCVVGNRVKPRPAANTSARASRRWGRRLTRGIIGSVPAGLERQPFSVGKC